MCVYSGDDGIVLDGCVYLGGLLHCNRDGCNRDGWEEKGIVMERYVCIHVLTQCRVYL